MTQNGQGLTLSDVRRIFREWQVLSDEIDVLKPQAWSLTDDSQTLNRIAQDIGALTLRRIEIFNTPASLRDDLETFFAAQDTHKNPEMREYYRWFAHTAYLPRAEAEQFQREAARMEQKFMDFAAIEDTNGPQAAWAAQAAELESMFDLRRRLAAPVAANLGIKPSEVSLDYWNPHTRNHEVDDLITALGAFKPMLHSFFAGHVDAAISHKPHTLPPIPDTHEAEVAALFTDLRQAIMDQAGWTAARLAKENITVHPITFGENGFCWGAPNDIRMGVEYVDGNFLRGVKNMLHETGHLLYMLSRNDAPDLIKGTPVGHINGYSIHEAAAMTIEQAGAKPGFAAALEPLLREYLPDLVLDATGSTRPEWSKENFLLSFTTQDHEGTYWYANEPALIPNMIWRTLAERKIMDAEMTVQDLPQFWADTMQEWTGRAHDPAEFTLTESHWLDDSAGYFWAYQFGAITASLSHAAVAATQDNAKPAPALKDSFAPVSGDQKQLALARSGAYFAQYIDFLKTNIFEKHCLETPQSIMNGLAVTAHTRDTAYHDYLRNITGLDRAAAPAATPVKSSKPTKK